ncbi:MAG: hypothetical protein IT196_05490 [Acidimicrobiales bacterium]|nr:hypothetical protein [Acidimicrobiales bacterium]
MITVTELDTLSLVPPARFGHLLAEYRWASGVDLESLSHLTIGRFDVVDLADIEAGRRPLADDDLVLLSAIYGVHSEGAVHPRRTRLTIDLEEGFLASGSHRRLLHPDDLVDDVLVRYLGLIIALRGAAPGAQLPLRHDDLLVLSDALLFEPEEIETRLATLMTNPRDRVGRRVRRLSRRTVVPEAGILVAATGEGLLVLDGNGEQPDGGIALRPATVGSNVIALARRERPEAESFAARSA